MFVDEGRWWWGWGGGVIGGGGRVSDPVLLGLGLRSLETCTFKGALNRKGKLA